MGACAAQKGKSRRLGRVSKRITFTYGGEIVGLLEGEGFTDEVTGPIGAQGVLILPDDEGCVVAALRSRVMVDRQHARLSLKPWQEALQEYRCCPEFARAYPGPC